jgi:hypothetical protein
MLKPITVAVRTKACTFFYHLEIRIMGSNPTKGMDVYLCQRCHV